MLNLPPLCLPACLLVALLQSMDAQEADKLRLQELVATNGAPPSSNGTSTSSSSNGAARPASAAAAAAAGKSGSKADFLLNLDLWYDTGFPTAVSVAVVACCKGVKRAHLVDARTDGGMLLELYSRDGCGTMISTDFYEGIRAASSADLDAVQVRGEPVCVGVGGGGVHVWG